MFALKRSSDGLEAKRDIYNAKSEINCLSALFQP